MCDDSRAQKQYWIRRMEEFRRQMEQEDLERQRDSAAPPGPAAGPMEPQQLPVARAGWRLGRIVACAVVALSILLFSAMSPAATFQAIGKGSNWVEIVSFD